jgi:glucuronosyltransferase
LKRKREEGERSLIRKTCFNLCTFHAPQFLLCAGLGVHFECPVIGMTTFGVSMWTNLITRTPFPPSYVPNLFTSHSDNMNFLQRLHNTLAFSLEEILWHLVHYPKQVSLYEKFFPQKKPELIDVVRNVSLILNNNHFSTSTIKPTVPNVIDIGGIHVKPAKALPADVKTFLDSATEGAIVFSMGSVLQSHLWPVDKREALVRAFSRLKQKVIWKYENDTLPNKPDNVMISKWLPQRDILAHKNVKLFITHGGLLGTNEAMYEGIPILAIPIYGDQKMNMRVAREKGLGLVLDFHTFTEEAVTDALDKLLGDEKIAKRAKELALIYRDRPRTPQAEAVYWVEYVIRHKGAAHLKSAALKMSYIEFNNIDVYLTILVSFLCLVYAMKVAVCKMCARKSTKQKTQ